MRPTAWASIDLAALRHNADIVRRLAPQARIMAMLKADAYGHGLVPVAQALAGRIQAVGVARLAEAEALRTAGWQQPILLLAAWLEADELAWCAAHEVRVTVHEPGLVQRIEQATAARPLRVWLKFNSGMNRLGFGGAEAREAVARLQAVDGVELEAVMTHLASADTDGSPSVADQLRRFRALQPPPDLASSIANSAGLIAHPATHADWVRPGIMLFGPDPRVAGGGLDLRPVMQLRARVLSVADLAAGERVGYGGDWQASTPARIATIGIGYGDGYPRHLPAGTAVGLGGQRLPLVGRVSMDMITVDVSARPQTRAGEVATLWGLEPRVEEIAERAGTISYELLSQVQGRVPRAYSPELP